eukprot:TCONS_00049048-protein
MYHQYPIMYHGCVRFLAILVITALLPSSRQSEFGIMEPMDYKSSNGSVVEQGSGGSGGDEIDIDISDKSLQEVCQMFNFTEYLCVCPSFHPIVQQICAIEARRSQPDIRLRCSDEEFMPRGIIMVSITIIGIIGNILVMLVAKHRWRTSTISQKLIGALALSDLIFSVLTFVNEVHFLWTCKWPLGKFMCKFLSSSTNMTSTMALGFILIISVERYFGIVHPFNEYVTKNKIFLMIGTNVLVSFIVVIPGFIIMNVKGESCTEDWADPKHSLIYSWVMFLITFLFPIMAISIFYIRMLMSLRAAQFRTKQTFDAKQQSQRKQEDTRITLILACLLISFVILVLPNRIYWILEDHGVWKENLTQSQQKGVRLFSFSVYLLHASINPFIYSIVDKRFRSNLMTIFFGRNKSTEPINNTHPTVLSSTNAGLSME